MELVHSLYFADHPGGLVRPPDQGTGTASRLTVMNCYKDYRWWAKQGSNL